MIRAAATLLATLAACATMAAPKPQAASTPSSLPETGAAWARTHQVPIDDPDDPRTRAVMDEIAGKRVVYLGEPDHYVHEKYEMRLLFVRRLFDRGWRVLGMEMGRSDARHVDAYLETGDEAELDRVGIYAGVKTARSGILKGLPAEAKAEFVAAEKEFARALRRMSEARAPGTPRLRYFGFDVDTDPLRASEELATRVDPSLRTVLERAASTDPAALAEALTQAAVDLPPGALRDDVLGLAESWEFAAVAFHDPDFDALMQAHARREQTMFRQVDAELARSTPVILMGHTMHLSKASDAARFVAVGQPGGASWRTIGTHVAERFPDGVYSIWMLADHGTHYDVACPGACEFASKPDSVEHVLAEVGDRFAVSTAGMPTPFAGEVNWVQNGRYGSGDLTRQADLIYFVREVTPSRGLGGPSMGAERSP